MKAVLLSFLIILSAGYCSTAQIIVTFAGSGIAGYNGDDEPATVTQLWSPAGIALSGGYVYVADGINNRIRRITMAGAFRTIAGIDEPGYGGDGKPATDALLNDPEGVATDAQGNVYIADKYNHRIRMITPAGIISTFAGSGELGYNGDGGLAAAARLNAPAGIAVDRDGNVYIADAGNNCIRKVDVKGKMTTIAGTGTGGYNGNGGPAIAIQLNGAKSIAVDTAGNVYIADALNYRVRKVTPAGTMSTVAGNDTAGYTGDNEAATAAKLNLPTGVAIDKTGTLFIADQGNNCIRKITTDGVISTVAGGGSGGGLSAPQCIALDGGGNIYVTEPQKNLVKRITPMPPVKIVTIPTKPTTTGKVYVLPPIQTPPLNNTNQAQSSYITQPPSAPMQHSQPHGKKGRAACIRHLTFTKG